MKNSRESVFNVIAFLLTGLFLLTLSISVIQFLVAYTDYSRLEPMHNFSLIRFELYGVSTDTLSGRFVLQDANGKEFARIERSWSGDRLTLSLVQFGFGEKKFFFPLSLWASRSEEENRFSVSRNHPFNRGTLLQTYYLEQGQCLFAGENESIKTKKALFRLGKFALREIHRSTGNYCLIKNIALDGIENGCWYQIVTDASGTIELIKE